MSRYRNTMSELLKQVRGIKEQDEKDHEISMARGELEAIADKATQLSAALQGKSDDGNPLEAWVQSKITKAKDYINSVSDYLMYNPDMKQNEELEEQTWAQQTTQMLKTIATAAGYKRPSSGDGYQAIWDYRNGKGKFQGKGKKTIKQTQDWVYRNGYKLSTDYLKDMLGEEVGLEEAKIISDISGVSINTIKKEVMPFNVKVGRVGPGMDSDYEVEFTGSEPNLIKYAKKHLDFDGNNFSQLKKHLAMEETEVNEVNIKKVDGKKGFDFKGQFITDPTMDPSGRFDVDPKKYYKLNDKQIKDLKEEVNEKTYGWTLVSKAKDIAKKFANNITKAVAEIEKLEKGLSKNPTVDAELRKYNENLEEKYTVVITKKDGSTMELGRYNTPAEAQRYVDMYGKGAKVKKEEVELDEIDEKISDIFKANKEGESINDIAKRLKLSTSMVKKLIGEDLNEQDEQETDPDKIALAKEKDTDALEKQLTAAQGQIAVLKQKIENEKNKAVKPLPNPETGEVPLTIGIAHKVLKDMKDKEDEEKKQKEISKQINSMAKGEEETKLESFTKKYLSHLNESEASDKAKAMGLTYMSFGRYGKDGEVTHKSVGGSLKALSKKDQEKDSDVKPTKPKTKTTGSIKNKDGSNTTSGSIKKEILKKIEDEDLTDPEILANFDVELTNLADDLAQTGDKETAEKITDALSAVEEGDIDPDAPAKIDDMMNALKGKPDLNTAKQKELSQMTSLYTDAKYSDDNVKDFVNDTASIINKMSEVAEAGSMDSDAYGPGIRSDAMTELVSTCSEIQDKIEDMDLNDDIKRSVVDALETITDRDTDEFSEEGDVVMSIENLKYNFKKLAKENKKERKSKALQSSGKKSKVTSDIVDVEPRDLKKQAKKYGLTVKIGSGDPDEGYEVEFKGPKKNILKYYKKYMGYDGDDFEGLGGLGDIDENKIIVHKTIIKEVNEVSDRLKLKVL